MEIASICHRRLGGLLPRWISRAAPRAKNTGFDRAPAAGKPLPGPPVASIPIAAKAANTRAARRNGSRNAASQPSASPRPLRVLQILDDPSTGAASGATGRLVISGRMADVCAELERLAALESRRGCA